MSDGKPAARVGDPIAHTEAKNDMIVGALVGLAVGVVLVAAVVATGGAALAVVAAVGGAAMATSAGGLGGKYIGEASMGPECGKLVTGSANVFINGRPATMTTLATAACEQHSGTPPLASGSSTVRINGRMAGRQGEITACSAVVIAQCSPNVMIGGASARDPDITVSPEVPDWAVTGLEALGVAGAVMALPYAIATSGVAATIGMGVRGFVGAAVATKGARLLGEHLGMSEAGIRKFEVAAGLLGGVAAGGARMPGATAEEGALAGARARPTIAEGEPFVSRAPFAEEPPVPAGGTQKIDNFTAKRPGGVDMDNLSPSDAEAAKAMKEGGWSTDTQKQVLNSGSAYAVRSGQQGEPMYKFSSAGRDEAAAPNSAYYTDQNGFDQLKASHHDESTGNWNGKGIKNDIALPCYNSADAVWRGTLNNDQPLVTSTTNPAAETVRQFNPDGSVSSTFTREMAGGGGQVTPSAGGVGGLAPYILGGN